jgi:hypothetical protein
MWHWGRNYIDFIYKHYKYENMDRSSAEGTAIPPNLNAPDDGPVGRNMQCSDEFEILTLLHGARCTPFIQVPYYYQAKSIKHDDLYYVISLIFDLDNNSFLRILLSALVFKRLGCIHRTGSHSRAQLVIAYQTTRRNNPEDHDLTLLP